MIRPKKKKKKNVGRPFPTDPEFWKTWAVVVVVVVLFVCLFVCLFVFDIQFRILKPNC